MATEFITKAEILADLWMNYRSDEEFLDFIEYNDLGLPLSYAVTSQMIDLKPIGENLINETFDLLLQGLGVEDTGFGNLDDLLDLGDPIQ
jgi:hypothetical protein